MAYTLLGRSTWGSAPTIYVNIYYDLQRSGSSMQYKIMLDIEPLTGTGYFGYPIYQTVSLDSAQYAASTLKNADPSQWSSDIVYETGWLSVSNKTSGTTALSVAVYSGMGSSRSATYTYSLTVLPASSTLNAVPAFNLGTEITISITKYNASFTDNLSINYGATTIKAVNGISNGNTVSFTSSELNIIYSLMSTVVSGTFTFTLSTYSGGTLMGTSVQTVTGTITNANPTLTTTVVDTNSATIALTGGNSILVKYKSTALISITAGALKQATIASKTVNGTVVSGTTLTLPNVSAAPFVVVATDSRGNSTTVTLNPVVINYVPLTISASAYRPAPTTNEISSAFSGNYFNGSFGVSSNILTVSWKYRKKGDTQWLTGGTFALNTAYTIAGNTFASAGARSLGTIFDYANAYEIIVYYSDRLTAADTGALLVLRGEPIINFGENGFNLNVPPSVYGVAQPYLVDSGTTGIWTWEKWSNGKYKCRGKTAETSYTVNQAIGNIFYLSVSPIATLPAGFIEIPAVIAQFALTGNGVVWGDNWGYAASLTNVGAVLKSATSVSTTGYFTIGVVGKWK